MLYGIHPIEEHLRRLQTAASQPRAISRMTLLVARDNQAIRRLRRQAESLGISVQRLAVAELSARCGTGAHRGVALTGVVGPASGSRSASRPRNRSTEADQDQPASLVAALRGLQQQPRPLVLVVDGVTDPVNLGTIARCADQFDVDLLLVPGRRAAAFSDTAMRVSAGAAAHVPALTVASAAAALKELQRGELWVYGADMSGDSLHTVQFPERVALVVGAEGSGLHQLVRERCDHLVRIPTGGHVDSLNVGVATGILLYEIRRQQRALTTTPLRGDGQGEE